VAAAVACCCAGYNHLFASPPLLLLLRRRRHLWLLQLQRLLWHGAQQHTVSAVEPLSRQLAYSD
jgi:hypothetical protein